MNRESSLALGVEALGLSARGPQEALTSADQTQDFHVDLAFKYS